MSALPKVFGLTLWERVEESGRGLYVIDDRWLTWVEPDCGRCAPVPYGCPPGSHMELIRELTWRTAS